MTSPLLWHLNRGTGVVLLVLLTATTVIGVLATGRGFHTLWPRFVTQGLHRALAGLTVALLLVHAALAVVDEYVDIRWWHVLVPFTGSVDPTWLGLGTLALDLMALVVVTSLLRTRLPHRWWFATHLLTYAAWAVSVAHGLGMGTDAATGWLRTITIGCVAAVVLAAMVRVAAVLAPGRRDPVPRRPQQVAR